MGWLQQVVVANEVIITTAGGGKVIVIDPSLEAELFYFPSAGPGNLLMSLAAQAGTDPYGNAFPQGLRVKAATASMPAPINGWTVGGHASYALDPLGNLVVSFKDLVPGTVADGTRIWAAGALPAAFRPADNRRMACYTDVAAGSAGTALEIISDGGVSCYGIGGTATRADLFAIVPLSF